ncbi:hypothetical protein [Maribellus sp. YY47]|uniref:hypothetical protein n=1 Tax=Maribellus sp. YY47 TaxID=2929486 RepID=UPI0020013895|nr:hypothetical protein [Maribellus sp. YY47]MCK3683374.1 hypothetical protein [Maribellus sp. YY47]
MEKVLFAEEQRVSQGRMLKSIVIAIMLGMVVLGYWFIRLGYSRRNGVDEIFSDSSFIVTAMVFFIVLIVVVIINSVSRLRTKIQIDGIYVSYFPFKRKWLKISASDIFSYRLRRFRAYREYGGYGIRDRRRKGKAYIISGQTGLQLQLKDGKRILIGTHRTQAIKYAMDKVMKA